MARRSERLGSLGKEVAALPGPHGDFLALVGDVRDRTQVEAAVEQALMRFGRLDVLVANAGLGHHGAVIGGDWDDIQTVLRTNIEGLMHCVRAAAPAMRQNGGGQILMISSVVAGLHTPYTATYAASKAFVSSLAGSLRLELEAEGIGITDVLVGRTRTEFNQNRRGASAERRSRLPTMSADKVAAGLVSAAERRPRRLILTLFDRLILAAGLLAPALMARLAKRQYQPIMDD